MNPLIPAWIIGGPFIGLLILSFSFKGPSAMGGSAPRLVRRAYDGSYENAADPSAPLIDPMHPESPGRDI
jgi:hypothetical protein